MKKKRIVIFVLLIMIVLCFLFKDKLIQTYVKMFHEHLEAYSENLLGNSEMRSTTYGLWDVDICHEEKMVEFMTGGFGLAPSTVYKGFYYSRDNAHTVFSVADASIATMEVDGDSATWTDGTDNNGKSIRIIDNWFWFEASF